MNNVENLEQQKFSVKSLIEPIKTIVNKYSIAKENIAARVDQSKKVGESKINQIQAKAKVVVDPVKRKVEQAKGVTNSIATAATSSMGSDNQKLAEFNRSIDQTNQKLKGIGAKQKDIALFQSMQKDMDVLEPKIKRQQALINELSKSGDSKDKARLKNAELELRALQAKRDSSARGQSKVGQRLQNNNVNLNNLPAQQKQLTKQAEKYNQRKAKNQSAAQAVRNDQIARRNNRLSIATNTAVQGKSMWGAIVNAFKPQNTATGTGCCQGNNNQSSPAAEKSAATDPAAKVYYGWVDATNSFNKAIVAVFTPAMKTLTEFVKSLSTRIIELSQKYPNLIKWVGYLIMGLIGLMLIVAPVLAAVGSLSLAMAGVGPLLGFLSSIVISTLGTIVSFASALLTPLVGMISGLLGVLVPIIMSILGTIVGAVISFLTPLLLFLAPLLLVIAVIAVVAGAVVLLISALEALGNWFSGWFGSDDDDDKKQAKKVQQQSSKVEKAVPAASEIDAIKNRTGTNSVTGLALAGVIAGGGALASENNGSVLEQQNIIERTQSSNVTVVTARENYVETDRFVKKIEEVKPQTNDLEVNKAFDKSVKAVNASTSGVTKTGLPEEVGKASQVIADNQVVADNNSIINESSSTEVTGDVTQIASGTRLSNKESNSLYVEGTKIEINVTADKVSDAQTLAAAIRRELEQQQAQQLRQLRGMLND